ncbi:MAG: M3 family metallopeptidase [Candidatus Calescibacterium sp.]|nr:M3 family metallopeptidase [Candidatus Calescibacterium sp.]MCX7972731.1 M3 family metallopeptidase [bacterium]MDW8195535.1 M3 family metallopeptidase [Candidatus Calescibacterium sp.]
MLKDVRWDLETIYPSPDSPEIHREIDLLKKLIHSLNQSIESIELQKEQINEDKIKQIILDYEKIIEINRKLQAYIICILSTDSKNEQAHKIKGILYQLNSSIHLLNVKIEKLIFKSKVDIQEYSYFIQQSVENYKHRMSEEKEELYSQLYVSSSSEWKTLYNELISNIKVEFEDRLISISQLRNYYNNPEREKRRKAYEKEIETFRENEYIFARILNSIKWDSIVISRERGFSSVLEQSLFYNQIDKEILDIVLNTAQENLSKFRRYFNKKAKILGLDKLDWFDLSAPIFWDKVESFEFSKAREFILQNFSDFSQELYKMGLIAFNNNWIDAEPRLGKTDGGFCIYIHNNESRILVNYDNSIKSVLTLAHELGHAYHNWVMSENTPIYRYSPLVLAETASILAETITRKNAIRNSENKYLQAYILDGYLYTTSVVVVDIISRFLFEDKVINIRKERILTPRELCSIMLDSQQEVYLDSINSYHPYMWANKPHYYSSNYYNYPYLIGLLIGLGLYNLYEGGKIGSKDYREVLKNSAKDKPEKVLKRIGIDIRDHGFWQEAFNLIEKDIQEFEKI